MREALLPYKARESDPEYRDVLVKKPETFWEAVCLHFGPGFWFDHLFFGRLRVFTERPRKLRS